MSILSNHDHDRGATTHQAPVCSRCGHQMRDRQYTHISGYPVCEHCLLTSRKKLAGLMNDHPYEDFVESLAAALDLREQETGLHSKRVASHTLIIARHFYKDAHELQEVYWGSLLHDVGKIGVPDAILLKPDKLTPEEWNVMQQHPSNGCHLLEKLPFLSFASKIVLCHEERFDGSGYPAGLKGEEIPLPARLFAIIDTLDAMTFDRPYRKGCSFDVAQTEITRMAGRQFDPAAIEVFVREEDTLREMVAID